MEKMKLEKIVEIKAKLVLQTGLHIGAGDGEMHIGGVDNAIIKHPITQSPYIPGSSLKGKMRTLLEWLSGEVREKPLSLNDVKNAQDPQAVKMILRLFGTSADVGKDQLVKELGVGRLSFWDAHLSKEWEADVRESNLLLTEVKSENTINRITSTAEHPRFMERIPAGAEFEFKLMMKQFAGDDKEALLNLVLKGLKLLEMDSVGGSGSRGYGKVKFEKLEIDGQPRDLDKIQPFAK